MPASQLEKDTISRGLQLAKKLLSEVKPVTDLLIPIYDGAGGVKSTLTQDEMDEIASLSGLTKAQLNDGMYVLTAVVGPALTTNITQLAELAARAT